MGSRGPVPKRTDDRRRRNKSEDGPIVKPPAGAVAVQPEPDENWHPMALDWYRSLAESGQSKFYEQSDWMTARIWAEILTRQLNGRISAQMVAAWVAAATELLTTEGARRRARVELQRVEVDEDEDASVTALSVYRDALEA